MQRLLLVAAGPDGERSETPPARLCRLIGRARPGPRAVALAERTKPDVVIVDSRGGGFDGAELARRIGSVAPQARIVVLTGQDDTEIVFDEEAVCCLVSPDSRNSPAPAPERLTLMRYLFTQELIAGVHSTAETAAATLSELGMTELPVIALAVGVDRSGTAASDSAATALAVAAAMDRALGDVSGHLCAPVAGGEQCVLLTTGASPGVDPATGAFNIAGQILDRVQRDTGLNITIGIGRYTPRLEDLPGSFLEASAAGRHGQVIGQRIIEFRELPGRGWTGGSHPITSERQLAGLVRFGDERGARRAAGELYDMIATVYSDPGELAAAAAEVIVVLSRAACRGGADPESIMPLKQRLLRDVRYSGSAVIRPALIRAAGEFARASIPRPAGLATIDSARAYIEQDAARRLTLSDVAAHLHLNPSYFSRLFKREAGMTFVEYLARVRIDNAKHLLATTGLEMKDVAKATGFHSQSYFSLVFRKLEGVPPSTYRSWFEAGGSGRVQHARRDQARE